MNVLIVCHAGIGIGLGHLTRSLAVARTVRHAFAANIRFLIQGESVEYPALQQFDHHFIQLDWALIGHIELQIEQWLPQLVIFDLYPERVPVDMVALLQNLRVASCKIVAIDGLLSCREYLDLIFIPSFQCPSKEMSGEVGRVAFGWDCFLLNAKASSKPWVRGNQVLVLTGGSDVTGLGQRLPTLLQNTLPGNLLINWVTGPYAEQPVFPELQTMNFVNHQAPASLDTLMLDTNYAVTIYGVSFFELLYYGVPTVVFSPYGNKDDEELSLIASENIALVAVDELDALEKLLNLMTDHELANALSTTAQHKMAGAKGQRLVRELNRLLV